MFRCARRQVHAQDKHNVHILGLEVSNGRGTLWGGGSGGEDKWTSHPVADLCLSPRQEAPKLLKAHLTIREVQASLECLWIFICP